MARILILGSRAEVLGLLAHILKQEAYQVRLLDDAQLNIPRIKFQGPDLVILDAASFSSGAERLCAKLWRERCLVKLPIIVLTSTSSNREQTAQGIVYVDPPLNPALIVSRVKDLLRKNEFENELKVITVDDLVIDPFTYRVTRSGNSIELKPLEFRLLYYLASQPNIVFRRDQLLSAVWNGSGVKAHSVDVAISYLRSKIEKSPKQPTRILSARGKGYSFYIAEEALGTAPRM